MSEFGEGPEQPVPQHEKSPLRFRAAMEANVRAFVREVHSAGVENIEKVPQRVVPVVGASHVRSDIDLQITACALDHIRNVGVSLFSSNRDFMPTNVGMTLAGQDRFFDIDISEKKQEIEGEKQLVRTFQFNPENYEVMKEAMDKGVWPIVAAHEAPIYTGILPDKSGFAVPYLAQLNDIPCVLPVLSDIDTDPSVPIGRIDSLDYKLKNLRQRPNASVTFCEPIVFPKIPQEDMVKMTQWVVAITNRQPSGLSPEESRKARDIYREIRSQGDQVMMAIARQLPEDRRGVWAERIREEDARNDSKESSTDSDR